MLSKPRPAAVTVIGWVSVGLAVMMVFNGAMVFLVNRFVMEPRLASLPADERGHLLERAPAMFSLVFENINTLAIAQFCFGVFAVYVGVSFLMLRPWARAVLEGITWLALCSLLVYGGFWLHAWFTMAAANTQTPRPGSTMFGVLGVVMGALVIAAMVIPTVVALRFLRGTTIRKAFSEGNFYGA